MRLIVYSPEIIKSQNGIFVVTGFNGRQRRVDGGRVESGGPFLTYL